MQNTTPQNSMDMVWNVTGLGDSMFLATFACALALYLRMIGYKREPLAVLAGFLAPALVIAVLKVSFYVCKANLWGIVSPSGHTAISIGVFGISALILSRLGSGIWRAILPILLILLMVTISASRIVLNVHTNEDVIAGSIIGLVIVYLIARFILSYRVKLDEKERGSETSPPQNQRKANILGFLFAVIAALILSYGIKLPSEKVMMGLAKYIKDFYTLCN